MGSLLSFTLGLALVLGGQGLAGPVGAQGLQELLSSGEPVVLATNRIRSSAQQTTSAFKARETGPLTLVHIRGRSETEYDVDPIARANLSDFLFKNSKSKAVLVYVHGFNNTVASAVDVAVDVSAKMAFPGSVIVFSWPSVGRFLPSDYSDDVRSASRSVDAMVELLLLLHETSSVSTLHVLGHSLGNDLLVKSLLKFANASGNRPRKFGEVIFCSPDISRVEFASSFGRIRSMVRGSTLWVSNSDAALQLATAMGRPNRAGLIYSEGPLVARGLDTVDVSKETRLFQLNHNAYRQVRGLFSDLEFLLKEERAPPWDRPDRAGNYKKMNTRTLPYWEYAE